MNPILATDYGNFSTFIFGVPALVLAAIVFGIALSGRGGIRAFVLAALISLPAGIAFLRSVPFAKHDDIPLTRALGNGALVLAGLSIVLAIYQVGRQKPRT